jgi:hypothetical protein
LFNIFEILKAKSNKELQESKKQGKTAKKQQIKGAVNGIHQLRQF